MASEGPFQPKASCESVIKIIESQNRRIVTVGTTSKIMKSNHQAITTIPCLQSGRPSRRWLWLCAAAVGKKTQTPLSMV